MDLLSLVNSYWWFLLALIVVGIVIGRALGSPRVGTIAGLAVTLVPPTAFAALYWAISRGGCSGGECAGAIFILMPVGLIACLAGVVGLGILIQALWRRLLAQFL